MPLDSHCYTSFFSPIFNHRNFLLPSFYFLLLLLLLNFLSDYPSLPRSPSSSLMLQASIAESHMAKHWDSPLLVSLSPSSLTSSLFLSPAMTTNEPSFLSFSSICASLVAWSSLWFWVSMCVVNGCVQQCKRAQFVRAPCICTTTMFCCSVFVWQCVW